MSCTLTVLLCLHNDLHHDWLILTALRLHYNLHYDCASSCPSGPDLQAEVDDTLQEHMGRQQYTLSRYC